MTIDTHRPKGKYAKYKIKQLSQTANHRAFKRDGRIGLVEVDDEMWIWRITDKGKLALKLRSIP